MPANKVRRYVGNKIIEHLRYRDEECCKLQTFFNENSCYICKGAIGEHQSRIWCKSSHIICKYCHNKDKREQMINDIDERSYYCEMCRINHCENCQQCSDTNLKDCTWCGKNLCKNCQLSYQCTLCNKITSDVYCSQECYDEKDISDDIVECSTEGCKEKMCSCNCIWWKGGDKKDCKCDFCVLNLDETKCSKCNNHYPNKRQRSEEENDKEKDPKTKYKEIECEGLEMKIQCLHCEVFNTISADSISPLCFVCNRPLSEGVGEDMDKATAIAIKAMLAEEEKESQKILEEQETLTLLFLEEEAKERQLELDNKLYTCNICFDDLKIEDIYILEECEHRFCRVCIGETCKAQINDGNTRHIKCPNPECDHIITYQEIRHVVDFDTSAKYEEFLLKAALSDDPNCIWCIRPGCSTAMIANPDDYTGNMIRCPNDDCKFAFCKNCKVEWHADSTCEMYQQWKEEQGDEEARYKAWTRKNAKECPKCKANIQKNGGCNHMTCAKCRFQFCWLCMESFKSGHYSHSNCKQFS